MRKLIIALVMLLGLTGATVASPPKAEAASSSASGVLGYLYQHAWFGGTRLNVVPRTWAGECAQEGYLIQFNSTWQNQVSSIGKVPLSHCNAVVVYNFPVNGIRHICYIGTLPLYDMTTTSCNDRAWGATLYYSPRNSWAF